jgi:hypothetical protein
MAANEWAVSDALDKAAESVNSLDAFDSIIGILGLALKQHDSYAFYSCCDLALQLANKANTTEQPSGLIDMLSKLKEHAKQFSESEVCKINAIEKWFRIIDAF